MTQHNTPIFKISFFNDST